MTHSPGRRARTWRRLAAVGVAALTAGVIAACGESGDDPPAAASGPSFACEDYDSFDGSEQATVSFSNDLMPIIQESCNSTNCHGSQAIPSAQLYLGPSVARGEATAVDVEIVLDAILGMNDEGVPSRTSPSTQLVVPGDPAASFFQLKVDGCHDSVGLTDCEAQDPLATGCGDAMPNDDDGSFTNEQRRLFRAWIDQGAPRN